MAVSASMNSYLSKITDAMSSPSFNSQDFLQLVINTLSDFIKDPTFKEYATPFPVINDSSVDNSVTSTSTHTPTSTPAVDMSATSSDLDLTGSPDTSHTDSTTHTANSEPAGQQTRANNHHHQHNNNHSQNDALGSSNPSGVAHPEPTHPTTTSDSSSSMGTVLTGTTQPEGSNPADLATATSIPHTTTPTETAPSPSNSSSNGGPSFSIDHSLGTMVNQDGQPVQGFTGRITTPDAGNTQDTQNPEFYQKMANLGGDIVRLDVTGAVDGRTIDEQMPLIDNAINLAKAAGLGVQLEFSQQSVTMDPAETKAFWEIAAPKYANDPSVTYEMTNEPDWPPYDNGTVPAIGDIYHVMRDAAPNKPIALLDYPIVDNAGDVLNDVHQLESMGVDFKNDPTSIAFHGYVLKPDQIQEIQNSGYAVQMTEVTNTDDTQAAPTLVELNKMGVGSFTLEGGFGMNENNHSETLSAFESNTAPEMKASGVDWTADGVVQPTSGGSNATTTHTTTNQTSQVTNALAHGNYDSGNADSGSNSGSGGSNSARAEVTAGGHTTVQEGENIDIQASGSGDGSIESSVTASRNTSGTTSVNVNATDTGGGNGHTGNQTASNGNSSNSNQNGSEDAAAQGTGTDNNSSTDNNDHWASWDTGSHSSSSNSSGSQQQDATSQDAGSSSVTSSSSNSSSGGSTVAHNANSVTENFDNGVGLFSNTYGDVKEGPGYIEVTSPASSHELGTAMTPGIGADTGYGYGQYDFTVSTSSDTVGPYALLWPASDQWPGPEIDVFELTADGGQPYSTVHWNAGGEDGYNYQQMPGSIDPTQQHTYGVNWQPDSLDFSVDGSVYRTETENVPKSYADGGENATPGVGVLTEHWADQNTVDNSIRLYDFSYTPIA